MYKLLTPLLFFIATGAFAQNKFLTTDQEILNFARELSSPKFFNEIKEPISVTFKLSEGYETTKVSKGTDINSFEIDNLGYFCSKSQQDCQVKVAKRFLYLSGEVLVNNANEIIKLLGKDAILLDGSTYRYLSIRDRETIEIVLKGYGYSRQIELDNENFLSTLNSVSSVAEMTKLIQNKKSADVSVISFIEALKVLRSQGLKYISNSLLGNGWKSIGNKIVSENAIVEDTFYPHGGTISEDIKGLNQLMVERGFKFSTETLTWSK